MSKLIIFFLKRYFYFYSLTQIMVEREEVWEVLTALIKQV